MDDENSSTSEGTPQPQGTSQHLLRTPPSPGDSPGSKKLRATPDPAPVARDSIKWIRHTLEEQSTKRSAMTVDLQRNTFDMLIRLDTAVHDLVISNLQLKSQLEESRRSSEICVAAAVAQFGAELRLREAAHEQTLEAVVARYVEKEATRGTEQIGEAHQTKTAEPEEPASYAKAVRVSRPEKTKEQRIADRSRSRVTAKKEILAKARSEEHTPAFVVSPSGDKTTASIRTELWSEVTKSKIKPHCETRTSKSGKVFIKPLNKETLSRKRSYAGHGSFCVGWQQILSRNVYRMQLQNKIRS